MKSNVVVSLYALYLFNIVSSQSLHTCDNGTSQFQCIYGGCIPIELKCNGEDDCVDGSDEGTSNSACYRHSLSTSHLITTSYLGDIHLSIHGIECLSLLV